MKIISRPLPRNVASGRTVHSVLYAQCSLFNSSRDHLKFWKYVRISIIRLIHRLSSIRCTCRREPMPAPLPPANQSGFSQKNSIHMTSRFLFAPFNIFWTSIAALSDPWLSIFVLTRLNTALTSGTLSSRLITTAKLSDRAFSPRSDTHLRDFSVARVLSFCKHEGCRTTCFGRTWFHQKTEQKGH